MILHFKGASAAVALRPLMFDYPTSASLQSLCRKPRGLLTVGLWTPRILDTTGFLRVESDCGPENQDEKMTKGVHWIEINSDFVIKSARYGVLDTRKYVKIAFKAFQKLQFARLHTDQPGFALPTERCSCLHIGMPLSFYKEICLRFSLKVKTLRIGLL
jgi:hypothetical protein